MNITSPLSVCVVSVTYGKRLHFLKEVIDSVGKQSYPVKKLIVVDNGSVDSLDEIIAPSALPVEIVPMHWNQGSAAGFSRGIQLALQMKPSHIWLLDDDNRPAYDALEHLVTAFVQIENQRDAQKVVLASTRITLGAGRKTSETARPDRFLGYHIVESMHRQIEMLYNYRGHAVSSGRSCLSISGLSGIVQTRMAPYGGLLITPSLVSKIGLPREDFVNYADDIEWTLRIECMGGSLYRCKDSLIYDLDYSWWIRSEKLSMIIAPETNISKLYYGIRNQSFIEYRDAQHKTVFFLNLVIRVMVLMMNAIIYSPDKRRSFSRFRILFQAINDGLRGKLGHRNELEAKESLNGN